MCVSPFIKFFEIRVNPCFHNIPAPRMSELWLVTLASADGVLEALASPVSKANSVRSE
jgi:hypothetical protein